MSVLSRLAQAAWMIPAAVFLTVWTVQALRPVRPAHRSAEQQRHDDAESEEAEGDECPVGGGHDTPSRTIRPESLTRYPAGSVVHSLPVAPLRLASPR